MKKSRLTTQYPTDFELIGIVSSAKEYQLAWHLNQLNEFHLVKDEDVKIDFAENRQIRVSVLMEETEFRKVYLLKNKLVATNIQTNQFLVQELQQFDFLLKLSSQTDENWANELPLKVKTIPVIDYCLTIDVSKIKMKDNLVF